MAIAPATFSWSTVYTNSPIPLTHHSQPLTKPLSYTITSPENDLILPAIAGVRSILSSISSPSSTVKRLVLTSSFASVVDIAANHPSSFTYTGEHWNPLTYAEAADPGAGAVVAYRGSKKFAELAAWEFTEKEERAWDLVTLCPPMVFGPTAHPISSTSDLGESARTLWDVVMGKTPLPEARVPVWIDVRDLANMHVEALLRKEAGGRRYVPCSPERYSYELARWVMRKGFGEKLPVGRMAEGVEEERPKTKASYGLDWQTVERELDVRGRGFEESVLDFVGQMSGMFPESVAA